MTDSPVSAVDMGSKTEARLCTRISRTVAPLSLTISSHHRSQEQGRTLEEGEAEPELQPVAQELQPVEESAQEELPEDRETEEQREVPKGVGEEEFATTEEIQEDIWSGLSHSLEKVVEERGEYKTERELPEAEEETPSHLTRGGDVGTSYLEVTGESEGEQEVEEVDTDSTVDCPLFRIPEIKCFWMGHLRDLKEHLRAKHADIQTTSPWICCTSLTNNVLIVRCYGDIFLYYKHITDTGIVYALVQQVGFTNWNFRYTIRLFSHERVSDNIRFSFRTTKVREPLEEVFGDCKCMVIDKRRLKPFIDNGELAMSVNIRPVHQRKRTDVTERDDKKGDTSRTTPQEYKREPGEEIVQCPLFKIPQIKCSWSGVPNILVMHLETEHRNILIRGSDFDCRLVLNNALLILFNDEIFLYYKYISYTIMYAVVQQVGMRNEKYTYIIELNAQDETVEDITFNLNVNLISEPFEVLFDARECMAVTIECLEPFIVNNELNMKVKIRSAHKEDGMFVVAAEETKGDIANAPLQEDDQETGIPNGKMRCPLFQIEKIKCPWLGNLESLEQHLVNVHKNVVTNCPTFICASLKNTQFIIVFNSEIFLYRKYVSDTGIMYAVIQQVGTTDRRYQYTIDFNVPGETTDNITFNFCMNKITESFEAIFKARRCMAIHVTRLIPFIKFNTLFMRVKITEVLPDTQCNE